MIKKLLLTLSCGLLAQRGLTEEKPNVVFIITDDQSWDTIQCMGGKVLTPRLDRMRSEGIYLSDFNVTSTVCSPSRYSFLTGRYAGRCEGDYFTRLHPAGSQTRVENNCELEEDRWNLAKAMQANGYRTGFAGKSHMIHHDWLPRRNWKAAGLESYPQNADPRDPEVNAKMQRNHRKWCEAMKQHGFDFADGVYGANLMELWCDALNVHNIDWTISKALTFMEQSRDDPFFLYVGLTLNHGPDPGKIRYTLAADPRMTGEGFVAEGFDVLPSHQDVLDRNAAVGFTDQKAHSLWLDDGIGAIFDKLEELDLNENTIVFFVPDHGLYRHGKSTLHDNGMRIPMLVWWKNRIPANATYDEIVANIDVAPTIMDLCGVTPPADYELDGKSFKSALFGSREPIREYLFSELGYSRAIKTKNWKYIAIRYPAEVEWRINSGQKFPNYGGRPPVDRPYLVRNTHLGYYASKVNPHYFEVDQLYNLKADPQENENLFGQYPEVEQTLKDQLTKKLEQFPGRPFGEFFKDPCSWPAMDELGAPDGTGVILKIVTDSQVEPVTVQGRDAWKALNRPGQPEYLYYKIDNPLLKDGAQPKVIVRVVYLDRGNTRALIEYDSSDPNGNPNPNLKGAFKPYGDFYVEDSNVWKTNFFLLTDAQFSGRCHGADFRLDFSKSDADPVVSDVSVFAVE
ncbi:sulfatase family protein [Tichowtungia aerotolerans]|uniref:Sulfatase-like hydrolase/transferase n=1 Tax=Tichowtungia aerotolerans TaxID=2697043 RepID=A0A6P1MCB0_9BACT|nr:sulfatase-like hydrolase/transferase [Tichowtungia aerotolerans]QHI69708.1 sulfatase-like hydrolase/transferase [Tichowtungia aerotolerans]